MIETIMTICALYTGQKAAECRIHLRHCVEGKFKSVEQASEKERRRREAREKKEHDLICSTLVYDKSFCDGTGLARISSYFSYGTVSYYDPTQEYIDRCAKKEGVL